VGQTSWSAPGFQARLRLWRAALLVCAGPPGPAAAL